MGTSPRVRGRLNEAGDKEGVQDGSCLLREGRVQSVWARLDRLCSGRDLDFKGVQRACTVVQFGRGKKSVFCECRAESVDSAGVPNGSVQCSRGGIKDSPQFSSRHRSSGGFVGRIERSAGVINDSVTGVTSSWASCGVRASKRKRGSDDDAVPEISSFSRSLYPVREIICQPEKTKQLEGFRPS